MGQYLKRIDIANFGDVEETETHYLKRVNIVEVVDSDGNPWEPGPGPDPFDELVVVQETTWSESNVYAVGETISGTSATFTGGTGNETYRSRVQYKSATDSDWTNTAWTDHLNVPKVISGVIPPGYEKGEVRFKTQAIDLSVVPLAPVNSIAPVQSIAYPPLVVAETTVSGTPYAGETITCAEPTVTGGKAPYTYSYMWLDADEQSVDPASPSNSTTIGVYDVGKVMNCYVAVNSADGQSGSTTTTNGVGPIQQYTIGTVTGQIDGVEYDPENDVKQVVQHSTSILTVSVTGNSPNINYTWSVRQGEARITPSGAMCTVVHQSEPPQGEQVQCDVVDNYASDDNKAIRFAFLVQE